MLFANKLKELREEKQLLQRQLASALEIDTPMYSRIERGERKAKREQVILLAKLLDANEKEFLQLWLSNKDNKGADINNCSFNTKERRILNVYKQ